MQDHKIKIIQNSIRDTWEESEPLVSIIIPCREIDVDTERCIQECEKLPESKEIIVVPDNICSGYPALKRNYAMRHAKGEIYAFIDSDAYPSDRWLYHALRYLRSFDAVCGPGVLPPDAPVSELAADLVFRWLPYRNRVIPGNPGILPEYPTFNLIVRKEAATPFDNFLTGEDSLFCRRIRGGVFYHPDILVYHHRRHIFKPLWKQVGTYGRHRGNFIKLAVLAWISSVFTYAVNFVKGIFIRRPS